MACPIALSARHVFGISVTVTGNGSYADQENIAYIAGQNLVLYNKSTHRQRFIQGSDLSDVVTAYTAGLGKRLSAIAERADKPMVHVYDMKSFKRKKSLIANESVISKEFTCLQFSSDDQLLLALSGSPDYTVIIWDWARAKISCTVSVGQPIYHCSFNPVDSAVISVIGKELVSFYRMAEKDVRLLEEIKKPNTNFISQCWLRYPDDNLLVGTEKGQIYLFQSGELISMLECSPGLEFPIVSMLSIPGGFFVGSSIGSVLYYQFNDINKDNDDNNFTNYTSVKSSKTNVQSQFSFVKKLHNHEFSAGFIQHMFLDIREENLGLVTSDGQLLNLTIDIPSKIDVASLSYLSTAFHGPRSIIGLDICSRKPLLATVGKDYQLVIWNYSNHTVEIIKKYTEEMYSVAWHSSGLHLAIGFQDKVRIYHVLNDDLRICLELPIKQCRECKFSKGGNMFAATHGNSILVYNFISGEKVSDLRAHNSKVKSLHWIDYTSIYLASCGQDGAAYLWDITENKRIYEYLTKGVSYTNIYCVGDMIYLLGNDKMIRQLSYPEMNLLKTFDVGIQLSNIVISPIKSAVFLSVCDYSRQATITLSNSLTNSLTNTLSGVANNVATTPSIVGNVRVFTYPIGNDFDVYPVSSSPIVRMKLSADENFVVTVDETGLLAVFELRDRQDRFQRNNPTITKELLMLDGVWNDDILIYKHELDDRLNSTNELQIKIDELYLHNEYQLKLKDMNTVEKLKEINDKYVQELEQYKINYELLREERSDLEIEYNEKLKIAEEEHQYSLQSIESTSQTQIMELVDNYQQLMRDRDAQANRLEDQRRQLVQSHEQYVTELIADFERKLEEERSIRLQLDEQCIEVNKEIDELQTQLEDDVDTEIEAVRRTYEEKLTLSREMILKYKGENGINKKKYLAIQREIEDQKEEIKTYSEKEKEYHDTIDMLEKEIKSHKKDIKTRDQTITDKERKIFELKKKNQELDKFKFVLDYKIRELKQQIEPRQVEIVQMKEKIKQSDDEISRLHTSNQKQDELIGILRERISSLQKEIKGKRQHAIANENIYTHFIADLALTKQYVQSPDILLKEARSLISRYGNIDLSHLKEPLDGELANEYDRHKDYLSKSIYQLKNTMDSNLTTHMSANNQLMQENLRLIEEINRQREQNRSDKISIQADIGKIRRYIQNIDEKTISTDESNNENESIINDPTTLLNRNHLLINILKETIKDLQYRKSEVKSELPQLLVEKETPFVTNRDVTGKDKDLSPSNEKLTLPPIV